MPKPANPKRFNNRDSSGLLYDGHGFRLFACVLISGAVLLRDVLPELFSAELFLAELLFEKLFICVYPCLLGSGKADFRDRSAKEVSFEKLLTVNPGVVREALRCIVWRVETGVTM